jgi:hypothetical protein
MLLNNNEPIRASVAIYILSEILSTASDQNETTSKNSEVDVSVAATTEAPSTIAEDETRTTVDRESRTNYFILRPRFNPRASQPKIKLSKS